MKRVEIQTERLSLTPLSSGDEDVFFEIAQNQEVRRYLLDGTLVDRHWVRNEIDESVRRFVEGSLGLYLARQRADARVVGFTGFRPYHDPPVLEVLYALLPVFWRKGLATEMASRMLNLAFHEEGHGVVRAAVDAVNVRSVRLLERLGMTLERRSTGVFGEMTHYVLPRERWTG